MLKVARKVIIAIVITVPGLLLSVSGSCLGEMTVEKILDNMERAWEEEMKGIEDLTIVMAQTAFFPADEDPPFPLEGTRTILQKREIVGGRAIYKCLIVDATTVFGTITLYDGEYIWFSLLVHGFDPGMRKKEAGDGPAQIWTNLDPSQTHYLGEEEIEGDKTHVLKIDDPVPVGRFFISKAGSWFWPAGALGGTLEDTRGWGQLWISDRTWLPRRLLLTATFRDVRKEWSGMERREEEKGVIREVKMGADFKDYHRVNSILIPYKKVLTIDYGEGSRELTINTTKLEVKVNTGLSDDLFDGTKIEKNKMEELETKIEELWQSFEAHGFLVH